MIKVRTLAEAISDLEAGSPCFCCGSPLSVSLTHIGRGRPQARTLSCERCGAEVLPGDSDGSAAEPQGFARSRLVAA